MEAHQGSSLEDQHSTLLKDFIAQCQPLAWENRSEMMLDKWFEWPPDVFALTSLIFDATGAYRRAASPPGRMEWPPSNWPKDARKLGNRWRNWVADGFPDANPLEKYLTTLRKHQDIQLDELYDPEEGEAWDLCVALLELHAIADEAMRGVGIAFSPATSLSILPDKGGDVSSNVSLFYLQANWLLALRGSLSRLPKFRGTILPKSRTPQVGMTLRSLSLHLTFHATEVDVAWRTFPWLNTDENILNLMLVPWPFKVAAGFFKPIYPRGSSNLGHSRHFHYKPQVEGGLDVHSIIQHMQAVKDEVRRVHIMVFPEMALTPEDLKRLQDGLEATLPPSKIPMIVTGVGEEFEEPEESSEDLESSLASSIEESTRKHFQHGPHAEGFNRVTLSLYYAGKWHEVLQDKHHRWKIDDNQIEQYGLGGILSGGRTWWESIQITRRKLSVLAANSWLTICPLICEDLARLEPVSQLLRGVGPTLLLALLMDGPQLRQRWSARYASVFADDPGSSVLTLTASGMSSRSIPRDAMDPESLKKAREATATIGLWKDQEKGWYPISISSEGDNDDSLIKILTVSAVWKSEQTADERADRQNSAVFTYQGIVPIDQKIVNQQDGLRGQFLSAGEDDDSGNLGSDLEAVEKEPRNKNGSQRGRRADARRKRQKTLKMCELTLFTYYVDALVDQRSDPGRLREWFGHAVDYPEQTAGKLHPFERELVDFLVYSINTRDMVPDELPTPHLVMAVDLVTKLGVKASRKGEPVQGALDMGYLEALKEEAKSAIVTVERKMSASIAAGHDGSPESRAFDKSLEQDAAKYPWRGGTGGSNKDEEIVLTPREAGRIRLMTPLSILWAIYSRLSITRRYGVLKSTEAKLLDEVEALTAGDAYHWTYQKWRQQRRRQRSA